MRVGPRYFLLYFYRMEYHATIVKYLKKIKQVASNEKDVKVDLILYNNQLGDIFSCKDKPAEATEADVEAGIMKGTKLREKRLLFIKSILPHDSLISSVEVTSAQFYGLSLTVYGSRMTKEGAIVHYQKAVASLPIAFTPPPPPRDSPLPAHCDVLTDKEDTVAVFICTAFYVACYCIGSKEAYSHIPSES